MIVMVFLKIVADAAMMFIFGGPIAFHFGASVLKCIVTMLLIASASCLSFVLRDKKAIRFVPFVLPFAGLLIPGQVVSWAIICGIVLAYAIFLAATGRYLVDPEHQKVLFEVTIVLEIIMIIAVALAKGTETSFSIVIFGGIISMASSIMLMRSLRHEPEVYNSLQFQAVNIGIMAGVAAVTAIVSSETVIGTILKGFVYAYKGVAYVIVWLFTQLLKGLNLLVEWLKSIFGTIQIDNEQEPVTLDTRSAEDLFDDITNDAAGFPQALKIILIVLAVLAAIGIIILIFRALAGKKFTAEVPSGDGRIEREQNREAARRKENLNAQVQGVRKQYRKYLALLKDKGQDIDESETSGDIVQMSQPEYRSGEARELRELYIKARYNGVADRQDAERAKELVKAIKKA